MGSENRKTAEKNTKIPQNRIAISQIGKNRPPPSLVKPQYHRYKIKIPAKPHQKVTQYRRTANPYVTLRTSYGSASTTSQTNIVNEEKELCFLSYSYPPEY